MDLFWGGWGIWGCDWQHHYVRVRVKLHNDFARRHCKRPRYYQKHKDGRKDHVWRHDPQHRKNAGYRDSSTAKRFGGKKRPGVRKKSSKSDFQVQEKRGRKQPKSNTKAKAKVKKRERPLAIIGAGRGKGAGATKETSAIEKNSGTKLKVGDERTDIKNKKRTRLPKQNLNASEGKRTKVKPSKTNAKAKAKAKKIARPLAISTGRRKGAKAKEKTTVIKKTNSINLNLGDAKTGSKNWTNYKPVTRNFKIPTGTKAGRGFKKR